MKASHVSRRSLLRLLLLSVACGLTLYCSQPFYPGGEARVLNRHEAGGLLSRAMSSNPPAGLSARTSVMKIARQITAVIGLKSSADKPAATPQPIARPASKPGGVLQGLSRQPRQAERPATSALRERAARPRVDSSALRRAASGTGNTDSAAR